MRACVLAAGRGRRLGAMTEARPKGLIELAGRPLIDWQLAALRAGGIDEIAIVTGYRGEMLAGRGTATIANPRWAETNMLASLLCAAPLFDRPVIVSYADIVYDAATVRRLAAADGEIVLAYDPHWLELWSRRFAVPLADAEGFALGADGRLAEIGGRLADPAEADGQYMGLLRVGPRGLGWLREAACAAGEAGATMDMTTALGRLVAEGRPVHARPRAGAWCEIDDVADLAVAASLVAEGALAPPHGPPPRARAAAGAPARW